MIQITQEPNLEILRQKALLLARENNRLISEMVQLRLEIARLRGENPSENQITLEVLRELEEVQPKPPVIEDPATASEPAPSQPKKPRSTSGPRPQPNLPVQEVIHELDTTDLVCDKCGEKGIVPMGDQTEDSEEIAVIERRFVLQIHKRRKYRCRCNGNVITAPGPEKLSRGGRFTPEFGVDVAIAKFGDHTPLERQARIMKRQGLIIDSQTLWDQTLAVARHLGPTYEAVGQHVREQPVIHADETRWPLLDGKGRPSWFVLGLTVPDAAFYRILASKSSKTIGHELAGYRGTIVADGFGVYEALVRAGPDRGLMLANCWAHVRRKFEDIQDDFERPCREILDLIGQLYGVERGVPGPFPGDGDAMRLRAQLREDRSKSILKEIRAWAFAQTGLKRNALGQAVRYMLKRWDQLCLFLEDPRIPLDNNAVERALRGPVVGRKVHYGSKSKKGTEVAALFYTLIETAKLRGVEPRAYLLEALYAAIREPGTVTLP